VGCDGCHLPRVTYGLLEGMMSHRPTRPRPQDLRGRHDQPDACTQCHVDRSRAWAADALAAWSSTATPALTPTPAPPSAPSDLEDLPQVVLDLYGGDPIQRALAAHALTRPAAPFAPDRRMAWLVDALEDDYPAVRWFAFRGLRQLAEHAADPRPLAALQVPHAMEDPGLRAVLVDELRALLGPGPLADRPGLAATLHERRDDQAIWIGE
jgi:hypothetical protein